MKSISPLPSVSKISITRCTSGFCCNSGIDINSCTLNEPLPSISNFLKRLPNRRISSASTRTIIHINKQIKNKKKTFLHVAQSSTGIDVIFPYEKTLLFKRNDKLISYHDDSLIKSNISKSSGIQQCFFFRKEQY